MRKERLFNNLFDYIDFNPDANVPCKEGRVKWSSPEQGIDICSGIGPVAQVPYEDWIWVFNDTGQQINNGQVIYPVGQVGGVASVALANATTHEKIQTGFAVATMDIPDQTYGIVTTRGNVRGFDTSHLVDGAPVWIGTTDGALTSTRPEFPNYAILIGGTAVSDADDGEIIVQPVGEVSDTFNNFWNGTLRETFDFRVTSAGGVITGTLTPTNGHDDMTLIFSDGFTMLDTNPGATVTLTAGTDAIPQTNYVYVLQSDKTQMQVSISDWPTVEHARIAEVFLQSAATTATNGALRNQNWNDHVEDTSTFQGHESHIGQWIRRQDATWENGAEATMDVGGQYISAISGNISQMHLQAFPSQSMPTDDIYVVNDPDGAYSSTTDLDTITKDSTGAAMSNAKYYSLVIWGVCNKTGEESHLMLNLPSGFYNSEAAAMSDALGYANYTIPRAFRGVGFLMARFVMQYNNPGWTYGGVGTGYQDLRGFIPNSTAGSGAGASGITTFLGLTDTPSAYTGNALACPQVNAGETALEFNDFLPLGGTRAMTGNLDMGSNNITNAGTVTGTSFAIGAVNVDGTELGYLDGAAAGTAEASKALIVDSNLDLDMQFGDRTNPGNIDGRTDPTAITDIDATPHAHWQFEDSDGNGTLAAAEGGATLALTLGTTDYCDVGTLKGITYDGSTYHTATGYKAIDGTGDWSVSFRIRPTGSGNREIFGWGDSATAGARVRARIEVTTNNFQMFFGNGNINSSVTIPNGEWSQILVVHPSGADYDNMLIYVDGVDKTGTATNGSNSVDIDALDDFTLGKAQTAAYFTGCIDELAIFDSALTAADALNIYNRQKEKIVEGSTIPDPRNMADDINTLGSATAGTMTIGSGSITDSSGAIDFGNETIDIGNTLTVDDQITITESNDSSAVSSQVTLGAYDTGGGYQLAISQDDTVVAETDETKFSHVLPVRINGTDYYIMLTDSIA